MGIFSSGHLRWRLVSSGPRDTAANYSTYSAKFVTLNCVLLATTETALVDELWEILFH